VRRRARVGYDSKSIIMLELFGMVRTLYVMVGIKKEVPELLMRGNHRRPFSGSMMKILGALEGMGKCCFLAWHVGGAGNTFSGLITRNRSSKINAELKHQMPDVNRCEQVIKRGKEKCSEVFRWR